MSEMIQALKASIKHWENLRDGKESRVGSTYCALCTLFLNQDNPCVGCPVHLKTGAISCADTPYYAYIRSRTPENAQKEVDFLKDILIEELEKGGEASGPAPPRPPSVFHVGDIITQIDKGMGMVKGFTKGGSAGVEFFEWDHGHDIGSGGPSCKAKDGHGWWCANDELTLVYRPA